MGITAKQRASFALRGTTKLSPAEVLELIVNTAGEVKGGGKSLLTTGIANLGAQVKVHRRADTRLDLALNSGKNLVELCTFSAEATTSGGATAVRVGGLTTYKTQQSKLFLLIPTGPKQIYGMDLYKRYLNLILNEIKTLDPGANLTAAQVA